MNNVALVGTEHTKGTNIRRRFYQNNIAGIAENTHDNVERHL